MVPKPWMLPLIVAAIAVPIVAVIVVAGPGPGLFVGALAVLAIAVVAARSRPTGPIEVASSPDRRRRILVLLSVPVEDASGIEEIAAAAGVEDADADAEVLVLAPARSGFLDTWASDVRQARAEAQRRLVVTVASLAKAHVDAEAAVGDADLVQAAEDRLRTFAATELILATGPPAEDRSGESAAEDLRDRLQIPFRRLVLEGP